MVTHDACNRWGDRRASGRGISWRSRARVHRSLLKWVGLRLKVTGGNQWVTATASRSVQGHSASRSRSGIGYSVGGKALRVTKRADGRIQSTAHILPGLSYTSSTHRGRSSTRTTSNPGRSAGQITASASLRSQQADNIAEFTALITSLHKQPYPPATQPQIPPPIPVDRAALGLALKRQSTTTISWWRISTRRTARKAALASVPSVAAEQDAAAQAAYIERVRQSESEWRSLLVNDPGSVEAALHAAFAHHEFPVATMVFHVGNAAVGLIYPGLDIIPESKPSTTATGRPTVAKRTKTECNTLYAEAISSATIATVRKALAAAPALVEVSIVVARESGSGLEPLYFGRFTSANMVNFLTTQDPLAVITAASSQGLDTRGQTHEIVAITPVGDDELSAILTRTAHVLAQQRASTTAPTD
jgi:hypothetical protein